MTHAPTAPPASASRREGLRRPAVRLEDGTLIPLDVGDLESFRRWSVSEQFPQSGRIDFLDGLIEVDMSPEDIETHSNPKTTLALYVGNLVEQAGLGRIHIDRTRLRSPGANLSCEPDLLYVSWESLKRGRVRRVRGASRKKGRFIELEGAADLAVEILSDGSVEKDTRRLPPLYARAGVLELWRVDARGPRTVQFQIYHLARGRYVKARADADGFQLSQVLGRRLRLTRKSGPLPETWVYAVDEAR